MAKAVRATKPHRRVKRLLRKRKMTESETDTLLHWFKAIPALEELASEARKVAKHYDGFDVGMAALLRRPDGSTYTVSGANAKQAPGPRQEGDHCAEDAMYLGDEVLGFVVVAPHKIDDFSYFDLGVTISCGHCRGRQRRFDPADGVKPYTRALYVNANEKKKRVELPVELVLALCEKKDRENGCA